MRFELSHKKIRIRVAGLVVEENKILMIAHKKGGGNLLVVAWRWC
ncbi:MAG TPA: hypothetical protein PLO73_10545 [Spirochaetota bacterium]|nr:hypothetical protein [Spirochaetota bacterium]HPP50402.1 hypothetical protein [Spirochaetota bacterium]